MAISRRGLTSITIASLLSMATAPPSAAAPVNDEGYSIERAACEMAAESLAHSASENQSTSPDKWDFACFDGTVTVSLPPAMTSLTAGGDAVEVHSGAIDDILAMDKSEEESSSMPVNSESIATSSCSSSTCFQSEYIARRGTSFIWGTTMGGSTVSHAAGVSLKTVVGEARRSSWSASISPRGSYSIEVLATMELKEYFPIAADRWVDNAPLDTGRSSVSVSDSGSLYNEGTKREGRYYHRMMNISIYDSSFGRWFQVSGTFDGPRFQCYKTAVCKFPYGREA